MTTIAPDIFRKRLLIEGFYTIEIDAKKILEYFAHITRELSLRTYGEPIVHQTSGAGKEQNQGYDAFVPLIDSGIYLCVWANQKFLSLILFTCTNFSDGEAVQKTNEFFKFSRMEHARF
jgi:S-adenosylmethionine decarboxylase